MIKNLVAHFSALRNSFICFILSLAYSFTVYGEVNHEQKISVRLSDSTIIPGAFGIKKGERLFYGLVPVNEGVKACTDCHYTTYTDTLNWNPSALDIARKYAGRDVSELISVVNNPVGRMMPEVHKGYNVTPEQAILLQTYLEKLNLEDVHPHKPKRNNLILFILVNLIGIAATVDLLFTRKIKWRGAHLLVILAAGIYITRTIVVESINLGRQENYAPLQPIKFSHKVHADNNQIECEYCHYLADRSQSAGIPPVSLCLNCHSLVVEGSQSGKFEIAKIRAAAESMTPVEWIRIHNLPDHVYFSHAQHVNVGKLDCAECHGPVDQMDVIYQYSDLSMGWCLDCHRTRKVDFAENSYYKIFEEYHEKLKQGIIDSVLVQDIGGTNCMKCHY